MYNQGEYKQRILIAVGNQQIETWLTENFEQRGFEFCGIALHKGQVLNLINKTMPNIIVLSTALPNEGNGGISSIDLLVHKIKTTYPACRIILICGDHKAGDEFLTKMVNKGVYDIAYGHPVQFKAVCEMILKPRDYAYASKLQAMEDVISEEQPNVKQGISPSQEKQVKIVEHPKEEPQNNFVNSLTEQNYASQEKKVIQESSNTEMVDSSDLGQTAILTSDTSILTSDMQYNSPVSNIYNNPTGIIFYPTYQENQLVVSNRQNLAPGYNQGYNIVADYSGKNPSEYMSEYLTSTYMPTPHGKLFVFASAREGVGCTSNAINTAYALADCGKKVLLVDINFGRSCIYQKLKLPENIGFSLEEAVRGYVNAQDISGFPLSAKRVSNGEYLPQTLSFIKLSDNFDYSEDMAYVTDVFNAYKRFYDYIIVDTSLNYINISIVSNIMSVADKYYVVTIQDTYEINTLYNSIIKCSSYINLSNKLNLIVNRTIKGGNPDLAAVKKAFGLRNIISIPEDTVSFMSASSAGRAYYMVAKKKIKDIYRKIDRTT